MENENETASPGSSHFLNAVFFNDRGLRAGWRLLIYVAMIIVFMFIGIRVLLFALFSILHLPPPTNGVLLPGPQILGETLAFLLMLLSAYVMSRIERRAMGVYGLPLKGQSLVRRFIIGYVFWGFLPLSICLFVIHLFHGYDFGPLALHGIDIARFAIEWGAGFILVGLTEEFLLRGYALYTLADGIGFWPAAIVLAVLFGIFHSFNPGETRPGLIATVVFALFASVTLRYTGNLWLAVGAHAGWDWGQTFFYGVNDSGMQGFGHLLEPSTHGPVWLTGGSVGPEGSAVTLILWTVMIALFALIYRRRGPALLVVSETKL
jgi:membrane protease YdiL (CAAX protease family)